MKNKFAQTRIRINEIHQLDPFTVQENGLEFKSEFLYATRMEEMLGLFNPEAHETLKLAAICQHFRRWEIPREEYPLDRKGYHQWRKALYVYQAEKAAEVISQFNYNDQDIQDIKNLISKSTGKEDYQGQCLEDVVCLVFVKYYLKSFSEKHTKEKLLDIVRRTKKKMSERALEFVGKLGLNEDLINLLIEAD